MADRVGRRATILVSLTLGSAGMVLLGMARDLVWIALATLFSGFFAELYRPAVSAMVADIVAPADRMRAYGLLHWAINLGFSIAPVLAGMIAVQHFSLLFYIDAATTLVYAALVALRVKETRPASPEGVARAEGGPEPLGALLHDRDFMIFSAISFSLALIFFQHHFSLPAAMRERGLGPGEYGTAIAVNGALIVIIQPIAARVLRDVRRRSLVLAAASALTGAGFGLTAWAGTTVEYALTIGVWTTGEILHAPVAPAVVADLAPPERRGLYQGAYTMVWGCAAFAAAGLGGLALGSIGANLLWAGCGGLGLVVAAVHIAIAPARGKRLAALRSERPSEISASAD